jgi:hypothetical protein
MKRLLPFVSLLILLVSCQQASSRPDPILSPEKMEPLLWELLQADQFVSSFVAGRDTTLATHATGPKLYRSILNKYGVSDSVFKASLAYYKAHPKQFLPMLDSMSQKPDQAPTLKIDSQLDSLPKSGPTTSPTPNIQRDPRKPPVNAPKPVPVAY